MGQPLGSSCRGKSLQIITVLEGFCMSSPPTTGRGIKAQKLHDKPAGGGVRPWGQPHGAS